MAKLPVRGTVSLGDLPTELIETFAEYLGSETISQLKLVNKRFYKVFTNDRFFKKYLSYPEHNYECIMKSEAKAHGAGEIVDDVKNGEVGRCKGYLQLEKSIIDNWRKGRFDTYDELPFPPNRDSTERKTFFKADFEIDYRYEHWFLCVCAFDGSFGTICLFNITAKPKLVATVDLGENISVNHMYRVQLLPDQVFVPVDDGRYDVYNIVRDDNEDYALKYSYSFEDLADKSDSSRGLYSEPENFLQLFPSRHLVITTSREPTTSSGSTIFIGYSSLCTLWCMDLQWYLCNKPPELADLEIWDLKTGLKVGKVRLGENRIWQRFVSAHDDVLVHVFEREFPSVIVHLYSNATRKVQITLFDVVKMEVTLLVDELLETVMKHSPLCGMYLNYLYVDHCGVFSLYLLESLHTGDPETSKHEGLLLRIKRSIQYLLESLHIGDPESSKHEGLLLRIKRSIYTIPVMFVGINKIILCRTVRNVISTPSQSSSITIKKQLFVIVINTSSTEVCKHSFSLANFTTDDLVTFVYPNLLVMRDTSTQAIKVFDTDGRELCSCENLKPLMMAILFGPRRTFQTRIPSVFVCESGDDASVRLYRF